MSTDTHQATDRFVSLKEVIKIVSLQKTTIYAKIKTGDFPQPVKLGCLTRWSEIEVRAWMAKKLEERRAA